MSNLDALRKKIDALDEKILGLLNQRAERALEIGRLKAEEKRNYHAPSREIEVLQRLEGMNPGPFPNPALRAVYREIMSASLSLEEPIRVAFLGPEATFSHLVCMKHYGSSARYLPVKSFGEVFDVVEKGQAHYGVVPVENSTEGMVNYTLDRFLESDLTITAEMLLEVSHHLMSRSGEMEKVQKIYSHSQPAAQCRRWLENHAAGIPLVEVESTAEAARRASQDPEAAAIASEAAVRIYDLRVIQERIEDSAHNYTRFISMGKEPPARTGYDKTSLAFAFKNEPGALFRMLRPCADQGINLTKIESRPSRKKAWEYIFFVDMEGHREDPPIREALRTLEQGCFFLRVLGSYPRARE